MPSNKKKAKSSPHDTITVAPIVFVKRASTYSYTNVSQTWRSTKRGTITQRAQSVWHIGGKDAHFLLISSYALRWRVAGSCGPRKLWSCVGTSVCVRGCNHNEQFITFISDITFHVYGSSGWERHCLCAPEFAPCKRSLPLFVWYGSMLNWMWTNVFYRWSLFLLSDLVDMEGKPKVNGRRWKMESKHKWVTHKA